MARAAAAAALLSRELDTINTNARLSSRALSNNQRASERFNTSAGRLNETLHNTNNQLGNLGDGRGRLNQVGNQAERSGRQIDRFSGRLSLIGQALAVLGPAAVPIAAVAIPAVAGLATALGFAALAGGTAVLAFHGVGDALKTMSKAHLEPTTENLHAAHLAMQSLSPAAQDLARKLKSLADEGKALRDSASEGIMPGVTKSLDELESRIPQLERILHEVGDTAGDIAASGAKSLASSKWDDFFNFLETDGRQTLTQLAEAAGNTAHALAEMMMAMNPLNHDFLGWMVDATDSLDKWATGLDQTQGFQDFINYIRTNGPQVAATFAAIGTALLDIVEAAAPLGGAVLQGIESLAKAISAIADSNLGTPIFAGLAAMSLLSRATKLWAAESVVAGRASVASTLTAASGYNMVALNAQRATMSVAEFAAAQRAAAAATSVARAKMGMMAGGLALMAASQTEAGKASGLSNTAMLTGVGLMMGGWGAAIGGAVGLTMDLAKANDDLSAAIDASNAALADGSVKAMTAAREHDKAASDAAEANTVLGKNMGWVGALVNAAAPLSNTTKLMGDWTGETERTAQAAKDLQQSIDDTIARDSLKGFTGAGLGSMAAELDAATISAKDLTHALATLDATLSRRASVRDYAAAIDAFTKGLKDNGNTLDFNTEKGRANLENMDNMASTALKVANAMKDPGRRENFLSGVLDSFGEFSKLSPRMKHEFGIIDNELRDLHAQAKKKMPVEVDISAAQGQINMFARQLNALPHRVKTDIKANGIPQTMGQVDRLVQKYHLTEKQRTALVGLMDLASPRLKKVLALLDTTDKKHPNPRVSADTGAASSSLRKLLGLLDTTDKKHPNPKVTADTGAASSSLRNIIGLIAGINSKSVTITTHHVSTYSGPGNPLNPFAGHAEGGLVLGPGTSTSDSIPILASRGEFVVKTAAVDKYGADFMHRVNAMQFASGGHVARAATIASASPTASLVGLRIEGRMRIDGSGAYIRGIVVEETEADRRFQNTRNGG